MFHENSQHLYPNVDYDCLRIYDENHKHFSMAIIIENQEGEQERAIGYNCIYRYGIHRIKLEFDIKDGLWKIIPIESDEQIFNSIFYDIQFLTLDQQIQIIIKRCDQHFYEIDRIKNERQYENKLLISASTFKEENGIKYVNNELTSHQTSMSLTIPEDDEQQKDIVDYGFHSFITGSRSKFSGLPPPPVAPRRSRQNSACSTQSSVRYASFFPPPTAPIRRRRVISSILLHVQRKKKIFDKIVDTLKGTEPPTMRELGLEFLRVYDGKFNYREGYTFSMPFRKKTWLLTIEQIKCVDCPMGEIGPPSVLILHYKSQYTSVHI